MTSERFFDRRAFMKWVAVAPLLGQIKARELYANAARVDGEGTACQRLPAIGREDRHQLPRDVDLPQRFTRVAAGPRCAAGSSPAFR